LIILSAVNKYERLEEDSTLDRLLDLDGSIMAMGHGYWVEVHATRILPTQAKPHGIDYRLCLLGPDGRRLVCYDNAHAIRSNSRSRKRPPMHDHVHRGNRVVSYSYSNAETLVTDFWTDVDRALKARGIP
jgi:hypothetical protein